MSGIMKKAILILLAAALLVPCLTGCSGGELKKVRVHEVTHSVFYAAQYIAMEKGFKFVASSPLVRSSYRAAEAFEAAEGRV